MKMGFGDLKLEIVRENLSMENEGGNLDNDCSIYSTNDSETGGMNGITCMGKSPPKSHMNRGFCGIINF
jgi:hypothetical protein